MYINWTKFWITVLIISAVIGLVCYVCLHKNETFEAIDGDYNKGFYVDNIEAKDLKINNKDIISYLLNDKKLYTAIENQVNNTIKNNTDISKRFSDMNAKLTTNINTLDSKIKNNTTKINNFENSLKNTLYVNNIDMSGKINNSKISKDGESYIADSNYIPIVRKRDAGCEIGQFLDFHRQNSPKDYDNRLWHNHNWDDWN